MVKALEDSDPDVAWLAADALISYGKTAWPTLLQALIESKSDAVLLRKGAHHVLVDQKEGEFNKLIATLLDALESSSAPESSAAAAQAILEKMKADEDSDSEAKRGSISG